jgi:hypothetical protein
LDDLVLVTSAQWTDRGHLYVVDVADPAAPRIVGVFALPAARAEIAVASDLLLLGNPELGLMVLRLERQ